MMKAPRGTPGAARQQPKVFKGSLDDPGRRHLEHRSQLEHRRVHLQDNVLQTRCAPIVSENPRRDRRVSLALASRALFSFQRRWRRLVIGKPSVQLGGGRVADVLQGSALDQIAGPTHC
jgi:hypothetical protein